MKSRLSLSDLPCKFRQRLLYLYEGKGALTGWTPAEVLEAAHHHWEFHKKKS